MVFQKDGNIFLKRLRYFCLFLTVLWLAAWGGFEIGKREGGKNSLGLDLELVWQVKGRLEETYLDKDKLDEKEMVYGLAQGLVSSLEDPYTVFLSPKENQRNQEDLAGEFGGVGMQLGYREETLAVVSPLKGTPAEKAGVKAGDLILKIVDEEAGIDRDTRGISLPEAVELIRGKEGSEVKITFFREGGDSAFEKVIKREQIVVPNLVLEWKEVAGGKVAVIGLNSFTERLFEEWPALVNRVKAETNGESLGIILDLRNNAGGFMQGAVMVASDFLTDGVIVKQEMAGGKIETYMVDKTRRGLVDLPLVVLVNAGSASAAEILAGALKEHGRAQLVGEKTFGKGTVQQPEILEDGSGLHITIARWLLPSGLNIHDVGVEPNELVEWKTESEDPQLKKALEILVGK